MIRFFAFSIVLLAASFAFANTPQPPAQMLVNVLATEHNGFLTECPLPAEDFPGAYCFRIDTNLSMSRLLIHTSVDKYSDLRWIGPWHDEVPAVQSRLLRYTPSGEGAVVFGVFLIEADRFNIIVMFVPLQG